MSDVVIRAEKLGKKYTIGHQAENGRYVALRDVLVQNARAVWHRTRDLVQGKPVIAGDTTEEVWALQDVSFEIRQGEAVGIIGRNGAGKSTLLKILSRITEPSAGRVTIRGRVASLLEVGTGFHPELTGRENIYLNGAILGMSRHEIRRKFDEIVAFAEVERYLDTPVKRYSSGMYVRLAFAVAAHLEPEILVVDEVLAVGDAAFQKKCLGKMGEVARGGRTVLFVSHQMPAILRLCTRALLLKQGRIVKHGTPEQVIKAYLESNSEKVGSVDLANLSPSLRRGNGKVRITSIRLRDSDGRPTDEIRMNEPIHIDLGLHAVQKLSNVVFGFSFVAADGTEIHGSTAHDSGIVTDLEPGNHLFSCHVDPMLLTPGRYYIRAAAFRHGESFDHIDEALAFDVSTASMAPDKAPLSHHVGYVYVPYQWSRVHD
ncbi:MAG: ABC transporter ATP-binding protein [Caldilineaceae bacterium]|nr:ABC transporter ATP-binding protein [Caldilineaceae bacterium]